MWLCRLINFQNKVEVKWIELNGCERTHAAYIQFAIGTHYSTENQMTLCRHPVNGTWIYFKVEEVGQKVSVITRIHSVLRVTLGGGKVKFFI